MKYLREISEDINISILSEENKTKKSYFIEGIFIQANTPNRNKRIYPLEVVEKEVSRYQKDYIDTKRSLGELGHPPEASINLDRVSHLITELKQNGNNFMGRAKLLDTPLGKIAKNFVDEGVRIGVSTRGFGTLGSPNSEGISEVASDYVIATVDCVFDPSAPDAFVNGIMENKEWMLKEGVITEMKMEQIQKQVKSFTKKQLVNENALAILFENFIKNI